MGRDRELEGTAVIRESETDQPQDTDDSWWSLDFGFNVIGKRPYRFRLEVRIPGREPYEVHDKFKVPRKVENTGFFSRANKLQPGIELPVRVSSADPTDVEVDWDAFLASPGRKQAIKDARLAFQNAHLKEQYARNPEMLAKLQEGNRGAVQAWANAVRAGSMSREEFEKTVALEVDTGRMDPAAAEAARRSLD